MATHDHKLCDGRHVRREWLLVAGYFALLSLFLALANWQFNRAGQKEQLLRLADENAQAQVNDFSALINANIADIRYRRITLTGRYDASRQFLLDNQIHAGKPGFLVLTPFIVGHGQPVVLVNRGWLPVNPRQRTALPDLAVGGQTIAIHGRINRFPSVGLKLAGAEVPSGQWPAVIQVFDQGQVSNKLGEDVLPLQIELDPGQPHGYLRDWQFSKEMRPERHYGYAAQWAGLALALTVIFIRHRLRRNHNGPQASQQ